MTTDPQLKGLRYIAVARCSTKAQADTSPGDQIKIIDDFASRNGMIKVDEIAAAMSASNPTNIDKLIDSLIERKQTLNDFDAIVFQDSSRINRSGVEHGGALYWKVRQAVIRIITALDHVPENPLAPVMRALKQHTDYAQTVTSAHNIARGCQSALEDGRRGHCGTPPYGLDKLYLSQDGAGLFRIRSLSDGRQLKLAVDSDQVLETYGRNEVSGAPAFFRKQKSDRVRLVPGDPKKVEAIRQMFRRWVEDDWGAYSIASELNKAGVPSPSGGAWCQSTILSILRNPIYTGIGVANRHATGRYFIRSKEHPEPATPVPDAGDKKRNRIPAVPRPPSDWMKIEEPYLKDLLPPHVREVAVMRQEVYWARHAGAPAPSPRKDKHRGSIFVLKGVLRSKQGGHPMTGTVRGIGNGYRYYLVSRGQMVPGANPVLHKLIPAAPIETFVKKLVAQTLTSVPDLRQRVIEALKAEQAALHKADKEAEALRRELGELERQARSLSDLLKQCDEPTLKQQLLAAAMRMNAIRNRLEACASAEMLGNDAIENLADQVVADLTKRAAALELMSPPQVRQILDLLVEKLEVDLETREVEAILSLPAHALRPQTVMGLDRKPVYALVIEAHSPRVPLLHLKQPIVEPASREPGEATFPIEPASSAEDTEGHLLPPAA
jgi:hypothetical protein